MQLTNKLRVASAQIMLQLEQEDKRPDIAESCMQGDAAPSNRGKRGLNMARN